MSCKMLVQNKRKAKSGNVDDDEAGECNSGY